MKEKFYFKFVLNTIISSFVLFWMFRQFFELPFIIDEIDLFENLNTYSINGNWSTWDYIWIIGFDLIMDIAFIAIYCFIVVPTFFMVFHLNLYKKYQKRWIELFKIHFFQILITFLTYYLFNYNFESL